MINYAQLQPFAVAGSGSSIGDTTLTLTSFNDIDGNALSMSAFGAKGYGTLEPSSEEQEEQISFTGVTVNSNGTVTLTGVSNVGFLTPYTETAGMLKQHAGGVRLVISNTSGFYNTFTNKQNNETISGTWTFANTAIPRQNSYLAPTLDQQFAPKKYVDDVALAGAPDATTTVKGVAEEATQAEIDANTAAGGTAARLFVNPSTLATSKYGTRLPLGYAADAGASDTYAVTLSPALSAYAAGQIIYFKANTANTGAATLNINGLGAVSIVKDLNLALETGDILANEIVTVIYDGTNFQIVSHRGTPTGTIHMHGGTTAPSGYVLCDGSAISRTTYAALFAIISTNFGVGDGVSTFNVPDMRGFFPIGLKSTDSDFDALNKTGGAKTKTLSITEMPAHSHTLANSAVGGGTPGSARVNTDAQTLSTSSQGSGTAFSIMNPFRVVNFIIKL